MDWLARMRNVLSASGIDLLSTTSSEAWDARAPEALRSAALLPDARGVIVVASAGTALFAALRSAVLREPERRTSEDPLDDFVSEVLAEGDAILRAAGVAHRRFEAAFRAEPRVDFRALGELASLGAPGPFGLLVHPDHGTWWALRGAWLVDVVLPEAAPIAPPCAGCPRPCVGDDRAVPLDRSTEAMRRSCPLGAPYGDEQVAYHHRRIRPSWLSR